MPATVYVITDELNVESTNLTTNGTMDAATVSDLAASDLVTVGNYTRTHPWLAEVNDREVLENEIGDLWETTYENPATGNSG